VDYAEVAAEEGEAQGIEQRDGAVFEPFRAEDGFETGIETVAHFAAGHDADGELGGGRDREPEAVAGRQALPRAKEICPDLLLFHAEGLGGLAEAGAGVRQVEGRIAGAETFGEPADKDGEQLIQLSGGRDGGGVEPGPAGEPDAESGFCVAEDRRMDRGAGFGTAGHGCEFADGGIVGEDAAGAGEEVAGGEPSGGGVLRANGGEGLSGVGAGADDEGDHILGGEEIVVDGAAVEEAVNGVDAGDGAAVEPGCGEATGGVETEIVNFLAHRRPSMDLAPL
jgi:hypothetical protein